MRPSFSNHRLTCNTGHALDVQRPGRSGQRDILRFSVLVLTITVHLIGSHAAAAETYSALLDADVPLDNVVAPLVTLGSPKQLPISAGPFIEHIRQSVPGAPTGDVRSLYLDSSGALIVATDAGATRRISDDDWQPASSPSRQPTGGPAGVTVTAWARTSGGVWYGSERGLYYASPPKVPAARHEHYGVAGPLATRITALAVDSQENLWVGTPLGLSVRATDGQWSHIRGREGLPVEDVTAIAVDQDDQLWIGTTHGAVHYRPSANKRKWFYRSGRRYLPHDHVLAVACTRDGTPYFVTPAGVSRLALVPTTLEEKARVLEQRVNERHRRFGLVAACDLNDAEHPTSHVIGDNDNDGLWTAYHVAALSLCYAATGDPTAKASAHKSMHALYMLQDASGTPGLVAQRCHGRRRTTKKPSMASYARWNHVLEKRYVERRN